MFRRVGKRERGHLLLGLLVLIAVSSILMARAVPTWQGIAKRDREEELIFRGESYSLAIRYFQKKNGRLPVSLEELHKKPVNFIRKLYKDPMTKDEDGKWGGDWAVIYAGPTGQPILPGQPPPGLPGTTPPGGNPPGSTPPPTPPPKSEGAFGTSPGGGPIIGVYSKSEDESIKVYDGKTQYNEWYFVMKQEQPPRPPGAPPGGPPPPPGGPPPPPTKP